MRVSDANKGFLLTEVINPRKFLWQPPGPIECLCLLMSTDAMLFLQVGGRPMYPGNMLCTLRKTRYAHTYIMGFCQCI